MCCRHSSFFVFSNKQNNKYKLIYSPRLLLSKADKVTDLGTAFLKKSHLTIAARNAKAGQRFSLAVTRDLMKLLNIN
jgi:hypothetical protein